MALFLLHLLIAATGPEPPGTDWVEFDRRSRGVSETPTHYEAEGVRRRGDTVRAWISYEESLSGLPSPRHADLVELDCARDRSRVRESATYWRLGGPRETRYHSRRRERWRRIGPGSVEEALARILCPAPVRGGWPAP